MDDDDLRGGDHRIRAVQGHAGPSGHGSGGGAQVVGGRGVRGGVLRSGRLPGGVVHVGAAVDLSLLHGAGVGGLGAPGRRGPHAAGRLPCPESGHRGAVRAHPQRDPVRGAAAGAGARGLRHRVHLDDTAFLAGCGESVPAAVGALRAAAGPGDVGSGAGRLAGVYGRVAGARCLPRPAGAASGDTDRHPGGGLMRARALAFAYRFSSGVRVSWASSTAFATLGTAVVTLLVLPLLDVLFDVLIGSDLSAPDLVRTGYAAALVALAVSVASGVVGTVATDRMLGVFQEVHTRRRLDVAYWLSVAVVPALLAASTATVAIGVVFALSPLHDVGALGRVITLAAPTIVCGLLMGIMAAGVGVNLPDPYLGATIIATFLPLLTGVIVPLEQCPTWLQALAHLVPVSGTLTVLDAPAAAVPALLGRDLVVAAVWAGIGLAVTRRAVTRLRQGQRTDTI
ncbi:hypothetical protein HMPREF0059_01870 [Actinomyces viscosus C505]|uniref:ABC-2 type transporter transmembrane domain-containing protein n=2 Tax=Actinomyces viscosus TaxID=1656 RepID=F2UZJ6_ACTVI|nr:hypothetical protein HMPREF0059_01870 [Actinomyces viscosus C505]